MNIPKLCYIFIWIFRNCAIYSTDYECIGEYRMTVEIESKLKTRSPQRQEFKLVMAGQCITDRRLPRTPGEYAKLMRKTHATVSTQKHELELVMADRCINKKTPRTPGKGTMLVRKTRAAVSPMYTNNEMALIPRNSNSECPAFANKPENGPPVGHKYKQLEPSHILLGTRALNNVSDSTHTDFSEYDDGTSGCGPCMLLSGCNPSIQRNIFSDEFSLSAWPVISSDINKSGYEKLNPETMESCQGSGISAQDFFNQKDFLPIDSSSSACRTSSLHNTCAYEKLNPETMKCLHGYGITSNSQDHVYRKNILANEFSPTGSCTTSSDINISGYEKLNPETMVGFQGFSITGGTQDFFNQKDFLPKKLSPCDCRASSSHNMWGYEKLNPEMIKCLHGYGITSNNQDYVERKNIVTNEVSPTASCARQSEININGYEKLNPETMESFQGFGITGGARDFVNPKDSIPTNVSVSAFCSSASGNTCVYERLNPETTGCLREFGIASDSQDHFN